MKIFSIIKDVFNIGSLFTGFSIPGKLIGFLLNNWKSLLVLAFVLFVWWKYHDMTSTISSLTKQNTAQASTIHSYKVKLDTQNKQIAFWATKSTKQKQQMKSLEQQLQKQHTIDQKTIDNMLKNINTPMTCKQAMNNLLANAPILGTWK